MHFAALFIGAAMAVLTILLVGFTVLMGLTMVAVCNAGTSLRAERRAAEAEAAARAGS